MGAILLLAAVTFLVYSNSLLNQFVFDDRDWVVRPERLRLVRGEAFRMVVRASYAIDRAISGSAPWAYHLTNIAYHAAAVIVLFLIGRSLFHLLRPALVAALLFAVHPIETESVAYVSGRRDVLSGLFVLAGFYCFLRYRRTGRGRDLALVILAYLLGFFSKESAVVLPLLCFAHDAVTEVHGRLTGPAPGRSLVGALWAGSLAAFRRGRALYVPLIVLAGGLAFYVLFLVEGTWLPAYHGGSIWFTLLTDARIFLHYLKLLVFPATLNADYSYNAFPITVSWADTRALAAVAVLVVLGYGLVRLLRPRPIAAFGGAWFFIGLLPAAHIVPLWELVAEHYLYVPSVGFFLAVVALVDPLLDRPRTALALYAAGVAILLLLSLRTVWRNADWRDNLTLYRKNVEVAPQSARARNNLGAEYLRQGRLPEAEEQLQAVLTIRPDYRSAHVNLGRLYLQRGDWVRAEEHLGKALALRGQEDPVVLKLWLGEAHAHRGRMAEAEALFRGLLAHPVYAPVAYNDLGTLLSMEGRFVEAESAFREAMRLKPGWAEPRENLARLHWLRERSGSPGPPLEMKRAVPDEEVGEGRRGADRSVLEKPTMSKR